MVRSHFNNLREHLKSHFLNKLSHLGNSSDLELEMEKIVNELKEINRSLDSEQIFESINNSTKLDSEELIKCYEDKVKERLGIKV